MKTIGFIAVLFIFLSGCQPEPLVVDGVPEADSKVVVSSVVGGERLLSVTLTRSYGALDGDVNQNTDLLNQFVLPGATIWIRNGDDEILLDEIGFGVYGTNDITMESGETYKLEAYVPSLNQTVTSQSTLKEYVSFDSVAIEMETGSIDTLIKVFYRINDLPGKNYYMINVQRVSERLNTTEEILRNRVYTHLVSDDEIVNGGQIEGEFPAWFRYVSYGDTVFLSLSHISFEYYDYLKRVNNGFLGSSLITEPFNFPTNINNGYGFFNLYYRDNRFLLLTK